MGDKRPEDVLAFMQVTGCTDEHQINFFLSETHDLEVN